MSSSPDHETFVANEDLSTHQYKLMVNSASNLVARQVTAGGVIVGVLQTKPNSGQTASVKVAGKTRMYAGGTIVGGNEVTGTLSGTATSAASGDYVIGIALNGVASGSIFESYINHGGWKS